MYSYPGAVPGLLPADAAAAAAPLSAGTAFRQRFRNNPAVFNVLLVADPSVDLKVPVASADLARWSPWFINILDQRWVGVSTAHQLVLNACVQCLQVHMCMLVCALCVYGCGFVHVCVYVDACMCVRACVCARACSHARVCMCASVRALMLVCVLICPCSVGGHARAWESCGWMRANAQLHTPHMPYVCTCVLAPTN